MQLCEFTNSLEQWLNRLHAHTHTAVLNVSVLTQLDCNETWKSSAELY